MRASAAAPLAVSATAKPARPNIYSKLGIKPIINGVGTVTVLGGSIMPPEVVQAMVDASHYFVPLPELNKKAGARIAELIGVPAAMITCGAASAITVGTSACLARGDAKIMARLPDTSGSRGEVIQQKKHRCGYEQQMLAAGARIVWVETAEEAERAINDRTAMMFFLNKYEPDGLIKRDEWIAIGKKHSVPTFNDAAADIPPVSNLGAYVKQGFDLVAFSGGKGLLGPQASGLLLGREDLIEAARPCMSPFGGIGRGMKVGKEEVMGLLAAVERYMKVDHEAEMRELERRVSEMIATLSKVKGITPRRHLPVIANVVPHLEITWDEGSSKPTSADVVKRLMDGDPPIHIQSRGAGALLVSVWMMRGNEHRIVARRLAEIFG
ncbi:MAG: aminotransferase class V-fold PLP-dependent enzyme [Acidobacteriales bacterium]|nr:aminotransferase class V-fold PLP-dependent enzyme [Terriglobales bacterium]